MKITIRINEKFNETVLLKGESLLDAVNKAGITDFDAPCGGKGTCGKCKVLIEKSPKGEGWPLPEPGEAELKALTGAELSAGFRLACRIFPESDMQISIPAVGRKAVIQSSFGGDVSKSIAADISVYRKIYLELSQPSIEDQRSDLKRLDDALKTEAPSVGLKLPLQALRTLPAILRENDFKLTANSLFDEVVNIEGGKAEQSFAIAVDIGTTTVVAYLLPLDGTERGTITDLVSALNRQKGYGADVISRIEYCMQDDDNLEELHKRITGQITGMVIELAKRNNIEIDLINLLCIAGNTTMTHLFAGFDPKGIAVAPFIPVITEICADSAAAFGLDLPAGCRCVVLPGIASYVGSDITAGIAATGMYESDELCLLIDIGTNGEIVLGSKDGMTACSTAAGPALEGANISCGMGGVQGAINRLTAVEQGDAEVFSFDVIDNVEPVGICGSGIVDAIALFVNAGVVDETGRILNEEELNEASVHKSWKNCIVEYDGKPALKITDKILITQLDIREIQMAKAAIAAGVNTLLAETGKTTADVKKLYIAGGFGAAMDKRSAAVIGLFPSELEQVVVVAGNTAGKGAVLSALSKKILNDMLHIVEDVNYIELSMSTLFQQEYMTAMYFNKLI